VTDRLLTPRELAITAAHYEHERSRRCGEDFDPDQAVVLVEVKDDPARCLIVNQVLSKRLWGRSP